MRRFLPVIAFLLVTSTFAQPAQQLRPPHQKMPIDCASIGSQPCTGTRCVHQQVTHYCQTGEGSEGFQCDNDSQVYEGGPIICCTGRNACQTCIITVNGRQRPFTYYNYTGVQSSCIPN